jgi:hypothetical protein
MSKLLHNKLIKTCNELEKLIKTDYLEIYNNQLNINRKLIELDMTDTNYNDFFDNYIKSFKSNLFLTLDDFIYSCSDYNHILEDGFNTNTELFYKSLEVHILSYEKIQLRRNNKKQSIASTLKRMVWNSNIGEEIGKSKCVCCKTTDITQLSFHCGHIIPEIYGGETVVSNLRPICQNCNSSMGMRNMNEFITILRK